MTTQLTLSCLLSADGKTATRSGESLLSVASPEYLERLAAQREAADCLLVDASSPLFEIPQNTALIIIGHSSTWQPIVDSLPSDKVQVIDEIEGLTAASLHTLAHTLNAQSIHCADSAPLSRRLLKEEAVDILNLSVLFSLAGGHAADTMTGNGAASAFASSRHFTLISQELSDDEMHLCYQSS
jgi:riboflavin biosynthesis pyrimidine reductase